MAHGLYPSLSSSSSFLSLTPSIPEKLRRSRPTFLASNGCSERKDRPTQRQDRPTFPSVYESLVPRSREKKVVKAILLSLSRCASELDENYPPFFYLSPIPLNVGFIFALVEKVEYFRFSFMMP